MPGEANGTFEIKFKDQKKFEAFGKNFSTCTANFGARASFGTPVPNGPLTYDVDFQAAVTCDRFLSFFNVAYEKTFHKKTLTDAATKPLLFAPGPDFVADAQASTTLQVPDYTATLKACGVPRAGVRLAMNLPHKAVGDPTAPLTLTATAVDSSLSYADPDVPMTMVNANAYVTLYAQAAARAVLKSQGVDVTNTAYLTTAAWYNQVVSQMMDLGFEAKVATTGGVQQNTYSGQINLGQIVNTLLSAYLGAAELSEFTQLADMLTSDPDNTQTTGFLDFWWSAASSDEKRTNLAFGPLLVDQGQLSVTAVFFSIDVAFTDWRSLFISFHHEGVNIASSAVTLTLDMDVYATQQASITAAVQGAIADHVRTTTLDFG